MGPNFDPIVKIKQQQDRDWPAGLEMKWVMGTSESIETKGKVCHGKIKGPMMSKHRAYDIV